MGLEKPELTHFVRNALALSDGYVFNVKVREGLQANYRTEDIDFYLPVIHQVLENKQSFKTHYLILRFSILVLLAITLYGFYLVLIPETQASTILLFRMTAAVIFALLGFGLTFTKDVKYGTSSMIGLMFTHPVMKDFFGMIETGNLLFVSWAWLTLITIIVAAFLFWRVGKYRTPSLIIIERIVNELRSNKSFKLTHTQGCA